MIERKTTRQANSRGLPKGRRKAARGLVRNRALVPGLLLALLGTGFLAVAGVGAAATETTPGSPSAVINTVHEAMQGVLQDAATTTYQQRFDRLAPALDQAYDFNFMADKALGRAFAGLKVEQQGLWRVAFRNYTISSYAGQFDAFNGQSFETLGEEAAPHETVLVRSRLLDPGKADMALNYRLQQTAGRWQIVDVYLKGTVSELALRRADFTAILEREGFEPLLASMQKKIATFSAEKPT